MKKKVNIIKKIAKFTRSQNLDNIPKKTKKILRLLILDWLAVALAGQNESVSKIIKKLENNSPLTKEEDYKLWQLTKKESKK